MKTCHLFAGIGGGLLADRILGHDPIIAVEWDRYACQVLRERAADGWFPNLRVWEGDVRLFDPSEYANRVDCIHAGFPCQDISVAGNQAGLGEGTRSGLYREVLRIAGIVKPRQIFLENVSAILSNGLGTVLADLAAMGYDSRWICIRASDVGAPHHRDRWWCMCTRQSELLPHTKHGRNGWRQQQPQGIENQNATDTRRRVLERGSENGNIAEEIGRREAWSHGADSELYQTVPDSKCQRLPRQGEYVDAEHSTQGEDWQTTWVINGSSPDFWATESCVGRVANGVPYRVGKLKGLGNAQVPLQAAVAWKLLGGE